MFQKLRVEPGTRIKLRERDPKESGQYGDREEVAQRLAELQQELTQLQELLYAENKHSLLIVLQAMDTGGKDGTIKHVMGIVNPQGCEVTSFKVPSPEESERDFLWRIHKATPARGNIGIFNRSHYEDVLVVRVHQLVPEKTWRARYAQINDFEKMLTANGTVILKLFLHISKDEQKKRLLERLEDPAKRWKFSEADVRERRYWDDYVRAYEDVFEECSTEWAPWYIISADRKWYRNLVVAEIVVNTLRSLNMKFPEPKVDVSSIRIE